MDTQWNVMYYETPEGKCPVEGFIAARNPKNQAKLHAFLSLLEERGTGMPQPYLTMVEEGIYEVQVLLAGKQVRQLYGFSYEHALVLTHGLNRPTTRNRKREVRHVKTYREEFVQRMEQGEYTPRTFRKQCAEALQNPLFARFYNQERQILGVALKMIDARQHFGLTQTELAKKARIKQQQLAKLEYGVNCDMRIFLKVCETLGLELELHNTGSR